MTLVIAKVRSACGDPHAVHLNWPRHTGLPRRNYVSPRNDILGRHREWPAAVWRPTCRASQLAKAHMDCRVETKVSLRNDNLEARHAILATTVGASACGGRYAYIFFLSVRKALSTIHKFSKFFIKINLFNEFL